VQWVLVPSGLLPVAILLQSQTTLHSVCSLLGVLRAGDDKAEVVIESSSVSARAWVENWSAWELADTVDNLLEATDGGVRGERVVGGVRRQVGLRCGC
jgi:hypothetical protein